MINEFCGSRYTCNAFIPSGDGYNSLANQICSAQGAVAGQDYVDGSVFIETAYGYIRSHKWRNVGVGLAAQLQAKPLTYGADTLRLLDRPNDCLHHCSRACPSQEVQRRSTRVPAFASQTSSPQHRTTA
jgi:hypothetical protein